jgi:hypothetical protein
MEKKSYPNQPLSCLDSLNQFVLEQSKRESQRKLVPTDLNPSWRKVFRTLKRSPPLHWTAKGMPREREREREKKALVGYRLERRKNRRIEVTRVSPEERDKLIYISVLVKLDYFILECQNNVLLIVILRAFLYLSSLYLNYSFLL